MKINLEALQFSISFRTKFIDYDEYSRNIVELLFNDVHNDIVKYPYFDGLPEEFPMFSITAKNGYTINISKRKTDIVYRAAENIGKEKYDVTVNSFSNITEKYVKKFINTTNICSKIEFLNASFINEDQPDNFIREKFCSKEFYSDAIDISLSYNRKENFLEYILDKTSKIKSRTTQNKDKQVFIVNKIDTHGLHENISADFICKFIDEISKRFSHNDMLSSIKGE